MLRDRLRRVIEDAATLLNLLLGTNLLWKPRPHGLRMRLRQLFDPDTLAERLVDPLWWRELIYAVRYVITALTTGIAGLIVIIILRDPGSDPLVLTGKLAAAAFVMGMGVLTFGAGRLVRRKVEADERGHPWRGARRVVRHAYLLHVALLVGSAGITVLGAMGFGGTVTLGWLTGEFQLLFVVFNALLIAQGSLTLLAALIRTLVRN